MAQLYMSDGDIVKEWREAKDRNHQIQILAELNSCSREEIIDILKRAGVDGRMLPRIKCKTNSSAITEKSKVRAKKSTPTNNSICKQDIFDYINGMKHKKEDLLRQIAEVDAELEAFAQLLIPSKIGGDTSGPNKIQP